MTKKMSPCCARLVAQLHHNKGHLAQLARTAAYRETVGRDISNYRTRIATTKRQIEHDEAQIADHEAEHAGAPV